MQGCLRSVHDNDGSNGSVGSDYPSERLVPQVSADSTHTKGNQFNWFQRFRWFHKFCWFHRNQSYKWFTGSLPQLVPPVTLYM